MENVEGADDDQGPQNNVWWDEVNKADFPEEEFKKSFWHAQIHFRFHLRRAECELGTHYGEFYSHDTEFEFVLPS